VKFTDEGSVRIRVSHEAVDRKSTRLRISVTDTGPGIAGHVRDHIFEKFTQADVSTTRKFGGTGLGLAICKDLVAMMGGEIGVESVPGEGSEFWFTALCEIGARADAVDDPPFRPATLHFDDEERRSLRVLVAEDNPVNQEIAKDTLELAGHRVDVVVNGIEAVEAVRKAFYDVVLMDAHMPEMDGPTATRKIRTLPGEVSKVPIIALTADAMVGDREKFLAAGMNDYVSKPFQPDVLFATIERWLRPNLADPSSVEPETQASAVSEGPAFGLDAAVVDPLRLGKPDLWKRLVEIFTANTPASIDKLTQALADEDRAAVHMVAHALKSSSANMGAARLSDLCRQLETASATAIPASGKGLLAEIRAEFDTVSAELESAHEPVTEGATA
jgi:CheY-like chemotaxis protein